jgi:hypothetical protein
MVALFPRVPLHHLPEVRLIGYSEDKVECKVECKVACRDSNPPSLIEKTNLLELITLLHLFWDMSQPKKMLRESNQRLQGNMVV